MFSRLAEREEQRKQNGDRQKSFPKPETIDANHNSDSTSARILPMPNRRANNGDSSDQIVAAATPENWNWSEPPKFAHNLAEKAVEPIGLLLAAGDNADHITALEKQNGGLQIHETATLTAATPQFRAVEILPTAVEPHLVAITQPRSAHCEEFRNLRTRILHLAQRQKLQSITIASGSPSEGKSTVALNLAWLLAQTDGVSALIIDSDLRLPCLADYLGVAETPGLSEVFSGTASLQESIVKLQPSGLHLLPGGARRDDVAEMLSGNKFRQVLEQTRTMFDFIIVDAPSLGTFTDASVLINQTDGALLVVRAGKTRYAMTNRLLETLPRERMLGVVLNGSDEGLTDKEHYDSYYNPERFQPNALTN